MLPLGLLRLLKPCKVKRFLATEDLSVVGLVTGSSGSNDLKWVQDKGSHEKREEAPNRGVERREKDDRWRQKEPGLVGV